jgi:hypothetical protein
METMMETVVAALAAYPILTLFLVIGLGYVFGEISLFGFRFGVAGVLFVGLAIGSLSRSPPRAPPYSSAEPSPTRPRWRPFSNRAKPTTRWSDTASPTRSA